MSTFDAGWLSRLKGLFVQRRLDEDTLHQLEETLIEADMGAKVAAKIVAEFGKQRQDKDITAEEIQTALAEEVARILSPVAKPFAVDSAHKPYVVLVVGVNGNGKTTTIGKLAHNLTKQGHKVILAAADTFRAAAVEQLKVWSVRTGCPMIEGAPQSDPASVAFKAVETAKAEGTDVLLIDSAGRLQNKTALMEELQKIIRVIRKIDPSAPHAVLQVLDATTGQNALSQVEVFKSMVEVSGLIVTKLDGTAKGGILAALADKFHLPIHAIGMGEGIDDLRPFEAATFARNLMGMK